MSENLYNHIAKFIPLVREDFAEIMLFFDSQSVKKKQNLVEEGNVCRANYFVEKGCLRMFFLDVDGTEQTIQFAIENWWMTDIEAFNKGKKAAFSIQAVENTEVLAITKYEMERMLGTYPLMESYFRQVYERAYAASLFRVKYIMRLSKEEIYDHFSGNFPEFVQRIPQKVLASFLGITPEYLSEIRKKRMARKTK
jgi:CRP-like cAMP-binding protein